ncbi:MAG TPA: adenosylmethionine decarboxylase, partial [Rhizomicrobium sp.]
MTIQDIEPAWPGRADSTAVGWQCVIDLHNCATPYLDDLGWVRRTMLEAAHRAEATFVSEQFHRFEPHGISGVVVIGESHLAVHIWPERNFAAVDVFTCNSRLNMRAAAEWLTDAFIAGDPRFVYFIRGHNPSGSPELEHLEQDRDSLDVIEGGEAREEIYIDHDDATGGHWFVNNGAVVTKQTAHQTAEILEFAHYGRALVLDGKLQSAERDEYIYHETLVQPALCAHFMPRRVLIIGGGEGATAREVLKHPTIEEVVMVDLDSQLVGLAREHLHSWHRGVFDDPRLRVEICDGYEFIKANEDRYNVIIVDIVDSFDDGPAEELYTAEFYRTLKERLAPAGILVVQGMECNTSEWGGHVRIRNSLKELFGFVRSYVAFVPSFATTWGFIMASGSVDPRLLGASEVDATIAKR